MKSDGSLCFFLFGWEAWPTNQAPKGFNEIFGRLQRQPKMWWLGLLLPWLTSAGLQTRSWSRCGVKGEVPRGKSKIVNGKDATECVWRWQDWGGWEVSEMVVFLDEIGWVVKWLGGVSD